MAIGIDFILRASTTAFTTGLGSANNALKDLKKSAREFNVGGGIGSLIGVGGIIAGFRSATTHAMELRDEAAKVGRTIDDSTASVARFGDAFGEVVQSAKGATVSVLGFFTRAGEIWGTVINRISGVTAEQEKMRESAAKAAEEQEKQLEKSRKENNPERVAAAERKLQEARRANLLESAGIQERINLLTAEQKRLTEEAAKLGENTVARKEKEYEIERVIGELQKAQNEKGKEQYDKIAAQRKLALEDAKKLKENEEQRVKVAAELAELAEQEAAAKAKQEEIAKNLKRLQDAAYADAIGFMTTSTLGRDNVQNASDATLKEIARRKQGNLRSLGAGGGGLAFDDNYFTRIQLQNEINQVKAELSMRDNLRNTINRSGIDVARRTFTGDPMVFDKLVQQFVSDSRTAADIGRENNKLLSEIRDKFKSGVPTISLTKRE